MILFFALLLYPLTPAPLTPDPLPPASAQQPANDMVVNVMIRIPSPTGRGFSIAGSDRGDEVIARVTTDANLCTSGVGNFALARPHDYSWEINARVVSRAAATVTAEVTWKQLEGPGAGGPPRSQTVVLKNEERVALETFRPQGTPRCATEATLEIEAGHPDQRLAADIAAAGRSGVAGGGGGIRPGAGAGASAGGGSGAAVSSSGSAREFALRDPSGYLAPLPSGTPFTVEIWLIRRLPNGTERVEAHDRAENVTVVDKKFGPVSIETAGDTASVTVGVHLRTIARAKDPLVVTINRDETFANNRKRSGSGGTSRVADIPGETEIVSLELPQSQSYADQFSVRLKFTKPGVE